MSADRKVQIKVAGGKHGPGVVTEREAREIVDAIEYVIASTAARTVMGGEPGKEWRVSTASFDV